MRHYAWFSANNSGFIIKRYYELKGKPEILDYEYVYDVSDFLVWPLTTKNADLNDSDYTTIRQKCDAYILENRHKPKTIFKIGCVYSVNGTNNSGKMVGVDSHGLIIIRFNSSHDPLYYQASFFKNELQAL